MPTDIYRWEEGGALVHHCPVCKTPLSNEMCKNTCLGQHVEWCGRYHTQLFRINWSGQCAPCRHLESLHEKRHREIAELLHQLKLINREQASSLDTPMKALNHDEVAAAASPKTKKERKAANKAKKLANKPKVISTADVDFVGKALHPQHGHDEAEEERRLLDDPNIKLNLYFHKGTSNTKEVRHRHLVRKDKGYNQFEVNAEELDALLLVLKVPKVTKESTGEETRLVDAIRKAVEDDLEHVAKEEHQINVRKAGFWRWASKKAYNRLAANGRLWGEAFEAGAAEDTPRRKDSAVAGLGDEVAEGVEYAIASGLDGLDLESSAQAATPKRDGTTVSKRTADFATPRSQKQASAFEDGWTQVGKSATRANPSLKLKMSGNGGLAKLQVTPKDRFGALGPLGPGYIQD